MPNKRPNILFIMTDDHAAHAMSCYGSRINETPHMDRIANEGMRFDNCFCTNSICTPSRATILTGTYNHINGATTLTTHMDSRQMQFQKLLQQDGYQTAIIGKWHLGHGGIHDPMGFDYWTVLPGQGLYHDPEFIDMGTERPLKGYATDLITDQCINWLDRRDPSKPFLLLCHHKAPHRHWEPDEKHATMYDNVDIPEPDTFHDDYSTRSEAAREARMHMSDLNERDLKEPVPDGMSPEDEMRWRYQRYIKDYLRCVASVDDNVGRLLDYLDAHGLAEDTVVVYTSDQGFFLGDHGWFDKRFMYEESLRMPFVIRYPKAVEPGSVNRNITLNVDFPVTFLDYAGIDKPDEMQGRSFRSLLEGTTPEDWQKSMYYRYWMHRDGAHNVYAHYGVRTLDHKLIYFYNDGCNQPGSKGDPRPPEWELYDLKKDPAEINNVYNDPAYADTVTTLKDELARLQAEVRDEPFAPYRRTP